MKGKHGIILLLVFLAAGLFFMLKFLGLVEGKPSWETYRMPEGGYSVSLPHPPVKALSTSNTLLGPFHFIEASVHWNGGLYMASHAEIPPAIRDQVILEKLVELPGLIFTGTDYVETERRRLDFGGAQALEVLYDAPDGEQRVLIRTFAVPGRVYRLLVVENKSLAEDYTVERNRFLNSFQLTTPAPQTNGLPHAPAPFPATTNALTPAP